MTSAIRTALVDKNGNSFWNILGKDKKDVFVKLKTLHISGAYYFCDAEKVSKDEFEIGLNSILNVNKYID